MNWKEILIFIAMNLILITFVLYIFKEALKPFPNANISIASIVLLYAFSMGLL